MSLEMSSLAERDDWNCHWDNLATSAEYNPAQRYRRKLILSSLGLNQSASAPRVLDIGSGQGDFAAETLAACPDAQVLGLELERLRGSNRGYKSARRPVPAVRFASTA